MLISELGLTTRTYNLLRLAGINTVDELKEKPAEVLWGINGLGNKAIAEIISKMEQLEVECAWMAEIYAIYSPFEKI